jgi:hypothetical protein
MSKGIIPVAPTGTSGRHPSMEVTGMMSVFTALVDNGRLTFIYPGSHAEERKNQNM